MPRTDVSIETNQEIVISCRSEAIAPKQWKPPFTMIGNGRMNRTGRTMNVIQIMASLPPASIKLFDVMIRRRNVTTNQVILRSKDLDTPRTISNHMPALIKQGLVMRLGHCHYLLNPDAVLPSDYNQAKVEWTQALSVDAGVIED